MIYTRIDIFHYMYITYSNIIVLYMCVSLIKTRRREKKIIRCQGLLVKSVTQP